ncbi:hypothetical protein MTR_0292s0040 [Medicago truncatula]|uniref:Uncharacterized protein n=1 Tax=Medicago truncatula TaxID=3880 RepID=A0A072TF28_MEDTR|nr:hypothetical protein MTR_0292s0040 [Medicago truncatula]
MWYQITSRSSPISRPPRVSARPKFTNSISKDICKAETQKLDLKRSLLGRSTITRSQKISARPEPNNE